MKLFSQRLGYEPVKSVVQKESMDSGLRSNLWDLVVGIYEMNHSGLPSADEATFFWNLWHLYFKQPVDEIPYHSYSIYLYLKKYFFDCQWKEVYDFVEFTAKKYPDEDKNTFFVKACNVVFEREVSAYRFVGREITELTSSQEIEEIEKALGSTDSIKPVHAHLERALELFADRKTPDYRNSIKESISAVESICKLISPDKAATLNDALNAIEQSGSVQIKEALKNAFSSLYGYTSAEDGIRHALIEDSELSAEDAKFMLVSCSAFVNYLIEKSDKAGIKL